MEYRFLGKTGVQVSILTLGTMTFGKEADESKSIKIMKKALDTGLNSFDTANIYTGGKSEEIVGRFIQPFRDTIFLASKVHFPTSDRINDRRSSRRHIFLSVEESLKRLRTDRLDLLYLHHWDDCTSLDESLAAIETLIQHGKVIYAGVSNFSAWQSIKALWIADRLNLRPIVAVQPMYNLLKRQVEVEILPMAKAAGLGVLVYSPQAGGMLTGKYLDGATGRLTTNEMYKRRYGDPLYETVVSKFCEYAKSKGLMPSALALAWTYSHPDVTSSIVGARSLEQFTQSLSCLDIAMNQELREEVSKMSPEPPLATDREKTTL